MFSDESTFRMNSRGATMRRPSTMYRYRQKYRVVMVKHCWDMKAKLNTNTAITSLPKLVEAIKLMWVQDLPWTTSRVSTTPCLGASRP
jgi:ABC-type phosphate transport system ATPase subunit